jgi:hypothetical protein
MGLGLVYQQQGEQAQKGIEVRGMYSKVGISLQLPSPLFRFEISARIECLFLISFWF